MPKTNPSIKNRPFRVVEYDPNWPKLFAKYSKKVRPILGKNLLEIHHLGSTSIPGMFAKPNIDMYALVKSLAKVRTKYKAMKSIKFTGRGDYSNIGEEYFTLDTPNGERIASLHIFEKNNARFKGYKNFRNYLMAHGKERERYISLKRQLYKKYKDNYPQYDAGKKKLISELRKKANEWAKEN